MNSRVSARRTIILRKDYDYELAALHIIAYHQRSHVVPTFCVFLVQGTDGMTCNLESKVVKHAKQGSCAL